jgi:hydrogenase maturation protein HypF
MCKHCFSYQKTKKTILALGAESDGNFCFFAQDKIYFSESFGDLLNEKNWQIYQKTVLEFLKINKSKPDIILTDLHPLYLTSSWGKELSQKYKAQHIQIQHHLAHIFSAIEDRTIRDSKFKIKKNFYGIAMDGTGYGEDGKIWGGEIFEIKTKNIKLTKRIGHLENQFLIGGDLAVREPARMLIGILAKFLPKAEIYKHTKKYYAKNKFELIYNQLKQNFNCLETSSTGRILDATSLLLGFCKNERKYKHEPISLLETHSKKPYADIEPKIIFSQDKKILSTTFLFEYLIKNLHRDKKRLATTAQLYIAKGFHKIIKKNISMTFIAGGVANNKIISDYLISQGAYANKTIPRGDAGLSFGQIAYYLFSIYH